MLTVPYFLTTTVQRLFRVRQPAVQDQQQPQQQQQQPSQQQQQQVKSPPQQLKTQPQVNSQQPLKSPQQQPKLQQQQKQPLQQQQQKQPLQQQQQQPLQQQQQQQSLQQQQQSVQRSVPASNPERGQASPKAIRPTPEVSNIQSKTSSPLKTPNAASPTKPQENQLSPQFSQQDSTTPPSSQPTIQKSSKTLVLAPSASGGRMGEQWAQQQVEKFKFDFDKADKDKSGTLSFAELYQVLQDVGFKGTEQEAKFIFGHLDRDKDQKITRDEFAASLKNLPRLTIKEFALRKAFNKLDKDNSGYLTRSEIEDATKNDAGLDIAAEKISDLLVYLCKTDKDKKVSYEEFLDVFGVESAARVMTQVFSKLDADGSGYLSRDEILAAVKSEFELKLKAEKISDLLCYWCKDADKKISYDEFVKVWLQQKEKK